AGTTVVVDVEVVDPLVEDRAVDERVRDQCPVQRRGAASLAAHDQERRQHPLSGGVAPDGARNGASGTLRPRGRRRTYGRDVHEFWTSTTSLVGDVSVSVRNSARSPNPTAKRRLPPRFSTKS